MDLLVGPLLFFFVFCFVIYGIRKYGVGNYSIEAFSNKKDETEEYIIGTDKLYDGFYAGIYDQLVQGQKERIPFEVEIVDKYCKRLIPDKTTWKILDIGCGTGDHISEFLKLGAGHVTGLDKSQAMINRARAKFPDKNVDWKIGDAITSSLFQPDEFNVVCFLQ